MSTAPPSHEVGQTGLEKRYWLERTSRPCGLKPKAKNGSPQSAPQRTFSKAYTGTRSLRGSLGDGVRSRLNFHCLHPFVPFLIKHVHALPIPKFKISPNEGGLKLVKKTTEKREPRGPGQIHFSPVLSSASEFPLHAWLRTQHISWLPFSISAHISSVTCCLLSCLLPRNSSCPPNLSWPPPLSSACNRTIRQFVHLLR